MENPPIPKEVTDVLENTAIGYLSTISKKGELYSYPVAFFYSDFRVYFVTPVSAAKYRMIKENPTVSLIIDNKQLTTNACGAMIQGRARSYSITRTLISILSLGPKVAGFSKKYPGMLSFYAKGKGLPDERKLYKYRIIQITPSKILYWIGYTFGKYLPKKPVGISGKLGLTRSSDKASAIAKLISSADEEVSSTDQQFDDDWLNIVRDQETSGKISQDERRLLSSYKVEGTGSTLSKDERQLLNKWKKRTA